MKTYEYLVTFSYQDIFGDSMYTVTEKPSDTVMYRGFNPERAHSLANIFNSGKGFEGFTPAFMLVSSKPSRKYA